MLAFSAEIKEMPVQSGMGINNLHQLFIPIKPQTERWIMLLRLQPRLLQTVDIQRIVIVPEHLGMVGIVDFTLR
ncbi:hypothetical protein D3C75_1100560 [compost metagenome]